MKILYKNQIEVELYSCIINARHNTILDSNTTILIS